MESFYSIIKFLGNLVSYSNFGVANMCTGSIFF